MSGLEIIIDINSPNYIQSQASDPKAHVFLRANAGSGKTRTLVNRVARLLLHGARADRILCLTFTKAAANEMQARLFKTLGDWAVSNDSILEAQLLDIGENNPDLNEARSLFARALETPGGLKIQTLHAFCEKLLRRFPLEAGLAPGFRVLDDAMAETLKVEVRRALFDPCVGDNAFSEARDRLIVRLGDLGFDNLLTSFMHKRHFFNQWLNWFPKDLDPLFLIKASLGIVEDHLDPFGHDFKNMILSTEGKTSLEVLTNEKNKTPQKLAESLTDWAWNFEPTGAHFLKLRSRFYTGQNQPNHHVQMIRVEQDFIKTFFDGIEQRFQYLLTHRLATETNDLRLVFGRISNQWEQITTALGVLSFDDQIEFARSLLNRSDMADWVRFKLDEGLEHILVDEAQDTSQAQWSIIAPLADEFFDGEGQFEKRWRTYFAVGDEKQSIYGFQGADPKSFRSEESRIRGKAENAGEAIGNFDLNHSFRSLASILNLVDQVFRHPSRAFSVTLPTEAMGMAAGIDQAVIRHIPWRETPFGRVELYPILREKKRDDASGVDEQAGSDSKTVDEGLAWQIANDIKGALDKGALIMENNKTRPVTPGDILVLVRDRSSVFEHLIRALKSLKVPIAGADRLKLENHIVFKDIRALMRVAISPEDDLSLALLLRSPFIGISEKDLFELSNRPEKQSLWISLCKNEGFHEAKAFVSWAFEAARSLSVFDFCAKALERRCPAGLSMRQRIFARIGPECEDVVVETLNLAAFCEQKGIMSVAAALYWFEYHATEIKREQGSEGPQSVRIMTVHGAKGLEAPWVIIAEKIKAKKQNKEALICSRSDKALVYVKPIKAERPEIIGMMLEEETQLQEHEHMRLLYVALTRACDRLSFYCAQGVKAVTSPKGGHWHDAVAEALAELRSKDENLVIEESVLSYCDYSESDSKTVTILSMGSIDYAHKELIDKTPISSEVPSWALRPQSMNEAPKLWRAAGQLGETEAQAQEIVPSPLSGLSSRGSGLGLYGRGLIIHKLLELLPECPYEDQESLLHKLLARQSNIDEAQRAEIYKATLDVLQHPEFRPLFGPNSRPEVALSGEIGHDLNSNPILVCGQVDRLVVLPDGVWVLDYKTNRPAPQSADKAPAHYVRQLTAYVALLRKIIPDKPIHAAFLWTDGPILMPLSDQLMNETLKEILGH
jgi:ATP-dependent helicase/nuclease subunit A